MSTVDNVLAHYGRKGMKWGVRRSNAELGSSSLSSKDQSDDFKQALTARSKSASSLSNGEMQSLITRMDLEKKYKAAMATVPATTRVSKAKKFTTDLLIDVGTEQVRRIVKAQATKTGNAAGIKVGLDVPGLLGKKRETRSNDD